MVDSYSQRISLNAAINDRTKLLLVMEARVLDKLEIFKKLQIDRSVITNTLKFCCFHIIFLIVLFVIIFIFKYFDWWSMLLYFKLLLTISGIRDLLFLPQNYHM